MSIIQNNDIYEEVLFLTLINSRNQLYKFIEKDESVEKSLFIYKKKTHII